MWGQRPHVSGMRASGQSSTCTEWTRGPGRVPGDRGHCPPAGREAQDTEHQAGLLEVTRPAAVTALMLRRWGT